MERVLKKQGFFPRNTLSGSVRELMLAHYLCYRRGSDHLLRIKVFYLIDLLFRGVDIMTLEGATFGDIVFIYNQIHLSYEKVEQSFLDYLQLAYKQYGDIVLFEDAMFLYSSFVKSFLRKRKSLKLKNILLTDLPMGNFKLFFLIVKDGCFYSRKRMFVSLDGEDVTFLSDFLVEELKKYTEVYAKGDIVKQKTLLLLLELAVQGIVSTSLNKVTWDDLGWIIQQLCLRKASNIIIIQRLFDELKFLTEDHSKVVLSGSQWVFGSNVMGDTKSFLRSFILAKEALLVSAKVRVLKFGGVNRQSAYSYFAKEFVD